MKKGYIIFGFLIAIILMISFPVSGVQAKIADGTYDVNYEMKENSNNNTSIADGYFGKPAKLTVKDGNQKIRITLTGASMIKSLKSPSGPVSVISDSGETRVVEFPVSGDLSNPLPMEMHIIVPKEALPPNGYDMTHTARAFFNVSGLPSAAQKAEKKEEKKEPNKETEKPTEENNVEQAAKEKEEAEKKKQAEQEKKKKEEEKKKEKNKVEKAEKKKEKAEKKKQDEQEKKKKEEEEKKKQEELEKEKEAKRLEKEKKLKKIKEEREKREQERLQKIKEEEELEAAKLAAEKAEQEKGGNIAWIYIVLILLVASGAGYGIYKYKKVKK